MFLGIRQEIVWTDEKIERLKVLHAPGTSSFATIAKELGVTKSAAIGKAYRLGLAARPKLGRCSYAAGVRRPKRISKPTRWGGALAKAVLPPPAQPMPPLLIPLVDTNRHQCKFIPGTDGLTCGHPAIPKKSWCAFHTSIVFRERWEAR